MIHCSGRIARDTYHHVDVDDAVPDFKLFLMYEISRWHFSSLSWNDDGRDLRILVGQNYWLISLEWNWGKGGRLFPLLYFSDNIFFKLVGFWGWYQFVKFIGLLDFRRLFRLFGISVLLLFFLVTLAVLVWHCFQVIFMLFLFLRIYSCSKIQLRYPRQSRREWTWQRWDLIDE